MIRPRHDTFEFGHVVRASSAGTIRMRIIIYFCLAIVVGLSVTIADAANQLPLQFVSIDPSSLPPLVDEQLWSRHSGAGDRQSLQRAIDYSLDYLQTPDAVAAYQQYPLKEFSRERVVQTLQRFRQLLASSVSAEALQTAVQREFELYQSIGTDGEGTVQFTGYFEPVYTASRAPSASFRYPIYGLPPDLDRWPRPHPTRRQLEETGLRGSELVWLRDRLEAYLIQVQGSAQLQLTDGTTMSIGYAGRTDYPYVSLGRELVKDGKIAEADLSLPVVMDYFRQHPTALETYIARNNRFVFFRETTGSPATGSLGVPVTPERSIATDKTLMPPAALALIHTTIPQPTATGLTPQQVSRFVLDQDTGGAIQGAGRVDIFMGTGAEAGDRAGLINGPGQLYYLLLKP
jgi:membrane-bound lytic murein transglycosylase A